MAPLQDFTLVGLRRLLAAGDLTAPEVVEHCLDRITDQDPDLHAFRTGAAGSARARAAALDEHRRRTPDPAADPIRFPLWGLPYAEKDLMDRAGSVSYAGSRSRLGAESAVHADPLLRLLDAGGDISLGRTYVPSSG